MLRLRHLAPLLIPFAAAVAGCEDATDYPPEYPGGPGTMTDDAGDDYSDTDPSALTDFKSTLDPHGQWVDDPTYGTVWIPNAAEVGADFAPYETHGHWVWDDEDEYVWVSDYDWGWAPFHYGRWVWLDGRGWAWIPGRAYAGAWVEWRYGYGDWAYVGWGPAAPFWIWRYGVAVPIGFAAPRRFWFCGRGDVFAPVIATHVIAGPRAEAIAAHTTTFIPASPGVGHRVVFHGPPPATLGFHAASVPRAMPADRGFALARAFARPATAVAHGGHAPSAPVFVHGARRGGFHGGAHFAPRGGGGFHGGGGHGGGHR